MDLTINISIELGRADAARAAGNEGRARVCARRAAGMAAQAFLNRVDDRTYVAVHGGTRNSSVYEALRTLVMFPGLAPDLKQAASHLTTRVDKEFTLLPGIDLIKEAHTLIRGLK